MKKFVLLVLFLLSPLVAVIRAQDGADYVLREVASGFTRPVLVTHAGDNRLFVVEQNGKIKIIQDGTVLGTPFLDVSRLITRSGNEQGLLGLAFHPDYANNGWFFINYTNTAGDTVVARYTVSADPNVADPASAVTVLTVDQPYSNHNGGNLVFGPDGYLYIGLGDGGSGGDPQNRAQNRQTLLGKMLRINVAQLPYTIPTSNPFAGGGGLPEIWALGLRNPWRYSFDRATGDLFIGDVGQGAWEEIDYQPASSTGGENYGWNVYEGNQPFNGGSLSGATMPVAVYGRDKGCSVTGGFVYNGFMAPGLEGIYLYGDFCSGIIWRMQRDSGGQWVSRQFMDTDYNISSFGEDLRGDIYVVDLGGRIARLESVNPPQITPTLEATPSETPTLEATLSETPTLESTLSETPTVEPTLSETPTLEATLTEMPTLEATLSEMPTLEATFTETPSLEATATETPLVEATFTETPTLEPTSTETFIPTNPVEPTLTPTPETPEGPTVRVDVTPLTANPGEAVSVALNLVNVTDVYGVQAACVVDPAVLLGVGHADGDGFNANNSFIVDHSFQADGRWLVAASRLEPNEAINGNATAFSFVYTVQSAGSSAVTCDVIAADRDGHELALTVVNGGFNGALPTPTIEPTLTETPTIEATIEPTFTETPEVATTAELTPEATAPSGRSTVSGSVAYQNRADNAGITVQLVGVDGAVVAETITAGDGMYSFDNVPLGAYTLRTSAALHLTIERTVLVETDGQIVELGSSELPAGDTDGNAIIDIADATFVGANLDVSVPPAPANADLNGDGVVNISDLVLVGGNFGLAGPVSLQ